MVMADYEERNSDRKPLEGVVLCSTALGQDVRTRVAAYAADMGARHSLDLTKDVTHLIVASVTTPKYQFVAKNRPDVKVVSLSWIEAARAAYIQDEDVDLPTLEAKHKYPTFAGLSLCITGFTHADERAKLEELFLNNGASYSGDLSKQIDHLVVAAPTGAKYTHAKQWSIPCVSIRWVTDSLKRGMVLDEALYDPLLPENEQGIGAFVLPTDIARLPRKRAVAEEESQDIARRRKFRRTASTRLETHSQDLWQGISAQESADHSKADQWDDKSAKHETKPRLELSVEPISHNLALTDAQRPPDQLFTGWSICLEGFTKEKERKLQQVLRDQCGSVIVQESQDLRTADRRGLQTCLLVPYNSDLDLALHPSVPESTRLATEWWVERCIITKEVISVDQDRLSRPFQEVKVLGFSSLTITSTGLGSLDLRQTAAVVKLCGAVYDEYMSPTTSVLLCGQAGNEIKKAKAYYALKHAIPVVTLDWLWASHAAGKAADFEPYRIHLDIETKDVEQRTSGSLKDRMAADAKSGFRTSETKQRTRGPFVLDAGEESLMQAPIKLLAPAQVQPLSERSPNASPTRRAPDVKSEKAQPITTVTAKGVEDLNANLASLSNQLQQARRDGSASAISQSRRRPKKLGRASSGILHRSASLASVEMPRDESFDLFEDDATDRLEAAEGGIFDSTQLGYELPDAEAHRQQMAKKMGLSVADDSSGRRLASLGVVKDSEHVSSDGIARTRRTRAGR